MKKISYKQQNILLRKRKKREKDVRRRIRLAKAKRQADEKRRRLQSLQTTFMSTRKPNILRSAADTDALLS